MRKCVHTYTGSTTSVRKQFNTKQSAKEQITFTTYSSIIKVLHDRTQSLMWWNCKPRKIEIRGGELAGAIILQNLLGRASLVQLYLQTDYHKVPRARGRSSRLRFAVEHAQNRVKNGSILTVPLVVENNRVKSQHFA